MQPHSALPDRAIDVWKIALEAVELTHGAALLAQTELDRAARFHFEADRRRYLASHVALRQVLSTYTQTPGCFLHFGAGEHGKPYLAEFQDLRFSLSYRGGYALVACSRSGEVGVDVEFHDPKLADISAVTGIFSPAELAFLRACPDALRRKTFFQLWTRKEAFVKATGEGLSRPLHGINVLGSWAASDSAMPSWTIVNLSAGENYSAALCHSGGIAPVTLREWPQPATLAMPMQHQRGFQ